MGSAFNRALPIFLILAALHRSLSISATPGKRDRPRKPPNPRFSNLISSRTFTDQSEYVGLGDGVGSLIALGDFTSDRYIDLLVVPDSKLLRSVRILVWNHQKYAFGQVVCPSNSSFKATFSITSIPSMPLGAKIVSASTFDSNADGLLDVLLILRFSDSSHSGILLRGNGSGCLKFDQTLPGLSPELTIMDANDDMLIDIFFISQQSERVFYVNGPPGHFRKTVWSPRPPFHRCVTTSRENSNAYVDINGDCEPDLVVSSSCGLEVWFNSGLRKKSSSRWMHGQYFHKNPHDFTNWSLPNEDRNVKILNASVWDPSSGDGRATFADINGDGSIDIAVSNGVKNLVKVSYNIRKDRRRENLCSAKPSWHFQTHVAIADVHISDTSFGSLRIQNRIRVGDFNYDGKADILIIDGESGTLSLYTAKGPHPATSWYPRSMKFVERVLFSITGNLGEGMAYASTPLTYNRFYESPLFYRIEDPLAATFIDLDESGRQDVLVSQPHGTRLIWNSYQDRQDAVYFKATGVHAAHREWKSGKQGVQAFSPIPGNTFKVSYGGRFGKETHTCTQCPQAGTFSLQTCSCLFGITRIANYIEEMAMGGSGGVRTWTNLMPNALAVIWPQGYSAHGELKWKISYLSKGRDGQMKRIVFVLSVTLVILFFAILYIHTVEKREADAHKFDFGNT